MAKINIELKTNDGFGYETKTDIDANVLEVIIGISAALCDVESKLPEADRQRFRSDFLQILNRTRKGEFDAE